MTDAELRKRMTKAEKLIEKSTRLQIQIEAHLAKIDVLKDREIAKKKSH